MIITEVTVGWSETCSLPEYCNIKPSITLTARLEDRDVSDTVIQDLLSLSKAEVRREIDDALEAAGKAPKYYSGPRYKVVYRYGQPYEEEEPTDRRVFVIPDECRVDNLPGGWTRVSGIESGMSRDAALRMAQARASQRGFTVIVVDDADRVAEEIVSPDMKGGLDTDSTDDTDDAEST